MAFLEFALKTGQGLVVACKPFLGLLVILAWISPATANSQSEDGEGLGRTTILVGYTPLQPPFAVAADGQGLVRDLLAHMSAASPNYKFQQKRLYAARVAGVFKEGAYDLIAFQNRRWGYETAGVSESFVLVKDRGAYFQHRSFEPGGRELLGATRGFHYAFADFSATKLAMMPNVLLTVNEQDVVNLVLRRRVSKGIASLSLLKWFVHNNKAAGETLDILEQSDYRYDRNFVVLPHSRISQNDLNALLLELKNSKGLGELFANYGLAPPPLTPPGTVTFD